MIRLSCKTLSPRFWRRAMFQSRTATWRTSWMNTWRPAPVQPARLPAPARVQARLPAPAINQKGLHLICNPFLAALEKLKWDSLSKGRGSHFGYAWYFDNSFWILISRGSFLNCQRSMACWAARVNSLTPSIAWFSLITLWLSLTSCVCRFLAALKVSRPAFLKSSNMTSHRIDR